MGDKWAGRGEWANDVDFLRHYCLSSSLRTLDNISKLNQFLIISTSLDFFCCFRESQVSYASTCLVSEKKKEKWRKQDRWSLFLVLLSPKEMIFFFLKKNPSSTGSILRARPSWVWVFSFTWLYIKKIFGFRVWFSFPPIFIHFFTFCLNVLW